MKLEPVIGLEIHVQLKTRSKMFCRCSTEVFGKLPNSYVCPTCLGLPGALPVTNAEAVRLALLAGEALGSSHPKVSHFDRKNYFYPDLPKGYQISQYAEPFNIGGEVEVEGKKISLTRAHLEEDAGKLIHLGGDTLIDFNRSGMPLLEIVTEPVIESAGQARAFGQKIQLLMRYAGVSDADMEKGSLRVDANISLRSEGSRKLGTKVEVKNMNSFRSVEKALTYEIERQTKLLESGKKIQLETRGWDEGKQNTVSQRVKEEAEDYRYFPEPDLPEIELSEKIIEGIKKALPDMPDALKEKFHRKYELMGDVAETLVSDPNLAKFYERTLLDVSKTLHHEIDKELSWGVAHWVIGIFSGELNRRALGWAQDKVLPSQLAELIVLFEQGKITAVKSQEVISEVFETGASPISIISKKGLVVNSDIVKLTDLARTIAMKNPKAVSDYKSGKSQAFGFLLGELIKETKGQADPTVARQALERVLK